MLIRLPDTVSVSVDDDEENSYNLHPLHRMTPKQSTVDPLSGKMDMNSLAAGMNTSSRKMVQQVAEKMARFLDYTKVANVSTKNLYKSMRQINKALQRDMKL